MSEPSRLVPPPIAARARPLARWSLAFGPRFFVLLLLGLIWVGPGWWDPQFLYGMVVWDLMVLMAWAWDLRQLPRPGQLEVQRMWNSPLPLNVEAQVVLQVSNAGRVPIVATVQDDVPPTLSREMVTIELAVGPGQRRRVSYRVVPTRRGDQQLGRVFLQYQTPFRIAERWAAADLTQVVRVYPNLEEAKRHTIYLIRSRQIELEKRLKRQRGLGREFESLREYREGDEWRDICWTATARRAKLIAKVYQIERSQAVWIVLDAGRLLRARIGALAKLDFAVNAALGLAQVALYSGDQIGLLAYGRKPQQRLSPARGSAHLRALIERLSLVTDEPFEAHHTRAAELLLAAQKRRSLIVWLTDLAEAAATPDVIEGASLMTRRHLVLFAVLSQPELTRLAVQRPRDSIEMYRVAAAQEMLHRRALLLGQLRQQGALAVELEPGQLSTGLVNHYLDIKERSLL